MNKLFRYLSLSIGLLTTIPFFAQNPSISTDLPNVIPPSPTVAGLMKFEEVPVNNYTGIPDISIPLYGLQSRDGSIGVNFSLNYHPGSIATQEVSGYTGLGWSLIAGGTISRTVRGLPDGINDLPGGAVSNEPPRYGIYSPNNPFYEINEIRVNSNIGGGIDMTDEDVKQYTWEALEKGWYDTEHDLYQYNVMGYSGRFIIKKLDENYIVEKLDYNDPVKIEYNHSLELFTLYDDKGNKYTFDIKEITTCSSYSDTQYFVLYDGTSPLQPTTYPYISAYHLSKITDFKNMVLAKFKYNPDNVQLTEKRKIITTTINRFVNPVELDGFITFINSKCYQDHELEQLTKIEPNVVETFQNTFTDTKKLQSIEVPNKAKIFFTLQQANLGTDNEQSFRLKDIKIFNWFDTIIPVKKFTMEYMYSSVGEKTRMLLGKVTESDASEAKQQAYKLSYNQQPYSFSVQIGTDYWGYFNNKPSSYSGDYNSTSKDFCRIDALNRMTLPTGGAIDFNFESNTYSYDGSTAIDDFENDDDWEPQIGEATFLENCPLSGANFFTFSIGELQEVKITAWVNLNQDFAGMQYNFEIWDASGQVVNISSTLCHGCSVFPSLAPGNYYVRFSTFNMQAPGSNIGQGYFHIDYWNRKSNTRDKKRMFGGGVRIGSISYFENEDDTEPVRKKNYNYNFFNDNERSSGSLTFPKPIFRYRRFKQHTFKPSAMECPFDLETQMPTGYLYETNTTFNNLKAVKTHGADVGYKNVTIYETGNGRSEFCYTSAIDYPEIEYGSNEYGYVLQYPFLPSKNIDFKRGVLQNEKHYDNYSRLLSEILYDPIVLDSYYISGFITYNLSGCRYGRGFSHYENYLAEVNNCNEQTWYSHVKDYAYCGHCGYANDYISTSDVIESSGWTKQMSKTTKEYFYKTDNTSTVLETKEVTVYNNKNRKPETYRKDVYKSGLLTETEKQEYFYLSNPELDGQNRISEILRVESSNEGLVSKKEITYIDSDNSYYPGTISVGKGAETPEPRIIISKYDAYKNPLEVSKKDGIKICYIRDWNTAEPLAMIENATYAQAINALGAPIDPNGYTKADIVALNHLRTALPDARVTTYTYKPLVGVESITDPRGLAVTYYYDTMGRLIEVRDHLNRILSQNEYNYRTNGEE